ncbi:hypothetical protein RJT34_32550 [Clitoria ternatea]|uniref:Uncharacterized protein n=1 Tax=Clitoria ternatea TaxID=43366 RepID=A0AAN9I3W6_CLITE
MNSATEFGTMYNHQPALFISLFYHKINYFKGARKKGRRQQKQVGVSRGGVKFEIWGWEELACLTIGFTWGS